MDKRKRIKCRLGLHYWWEYKTGWKVCRSCRKQKQVKRRG